MLSKLKNGLEKKLKNFIDNSAQGKSLNALCPYLFKEIRDFSLRRGKRIRPILFLLAYLGYSKNAAQGLYASALSLELLHDFLIIHDDIIDKSDLRRGKPSIHKGLDKLVKDKSHGRLKGEDAALIAGDVLYAFSIRAFLSIREDPLRKEKALKKFLDSAIYTGSGEFNELISDIERLNRFKKSDIYKIYDLKTSHYSFSCPLATGAILAGAKARDVEKLESAGIYLGRAFQIKDDLLSYISNEKEIGKPTTIDLRESRITLLIWHAYNNSDRAAKTFIKNILRKRGAGRSDIKKIKDIVNSAGSLDFANSEIARFINCSKVLMQKTSMKTRQKDRLIKYSEKLIT